MFSSTWESLRANGIIGYSLNANETCKGTVIMGSQFQTSFKKLKI